MANKITLKEKLVKEYKKTIYNFIEMHKVNITVGCKENSVVGYYKYPTPIPNNFILKSGEIIPSIDPIINYFIDEEGFNKSDFTIEEWEFDIHKWGDMELDEIETRYGNINDFYHPDVKDQKYSIITLNWRP